MNPSRKKTNNWLIYNKGAVSKVKLFVFKTAPLLCLPKIKQSYSLP